MKVKNANVSSKKTRQLIKDSFIELLYEKKDIKKVKVTELVKKANIDRTTFYSHYDNIYSVAQEFEDEFIDLIDFEIGKIKDYEEIHIPDFGSADCSLCNGAAEEVKGGAEQQFGCCAKKDRTES